MEALLIGVAPGPVTLVSALAVVGAGDSVAHNFSFWLIVRLGAVNAPGCVLILVEVV